MVVSILITVLALAFGCIPISSMSVIGKGVSIRLQARFLVKNSGIMKLIPFKAKYFNCYSIIELVVFLCAVILFVMDIVFIVMAFASKVSEDMLFAITMLSFVLMLGFNIVWMIINSSLRQREADKLADAGVNIGVYEGVVYNEAMIHAFKNPLEEKNTVDNFAVFFRFYKTLEVEDLKSRGLTCMFKVTDNEGKEHYIMI